MRWCDVNASKVCANIILSLIDFDFGVSISIKCSIKVSTVPACFLYLHDSLWYNSRWFILQNLAASFDIGDRKFLGKFLENETDSSLFIISFGLIL